MSVVRRGQPDCQTTVGAPPTRIYVTTESKEALVLDMNATGIVARTSLVSNAGWFAASNTSIVLGD